MRQQLLIAGFTAVGFAAGFATHTMTIEGPKVPPPPTPGAEFIRTAEGAATATEKPRQAPTYSEKERERLRDDIEKMRPQIDSFRKRMEEIAAEYDEGMRAMLNAEQRERFEARLRRNAERAAAGDRRAAASMTLSDEQIFQAQQGQLWSVLWNVAVNYRLERLVQDFSLTPDQQVKAKLLLEARREKFLALVDSTTPPTITLSRLAPQADKLAVPQPK